VHLHVPDSGALARIPEEGLASLARLLMSPDTPLRKIKVRCWGHGSRPGLSAGRGQGAVCPREAGACHSRPCAKLTPLAARP
jgi:hypothetical protein